MEFLNTFKIESGVYFSGELSPSFEQAYLSVRQAEGRLYPDELVRQLPNVPPSHKHYREWKMRGYIDAMLCTDPKVSRAAHILDLGCGNGWFSHQLASHTKGEVLGLDVNYTELLQAARLFSSYKCHFAYGDIFEDKWPGASFDLIVLLSAIQYFPSLTNLVKRLQSLLAPDGEIHIADSPIYATLKEAEKASKRSAVYFDNLGFSSATSYYHHHSFEYLAPYQFQILYDPARFFPGIKRKVLGQGSLFPWIKIGKQDVCID